MELSGTKVEISKFGKVYSSLSCNELGRAGLYDYGFRDYAPILGRFTTVDPIKDSLNWYVYVSNNPINMVDPTGLAEIYADDIHGNPILAWPTRDIKADTSLEINRDSSEDYYNDTLNVKIGNQTFQQYSIQSEADWPGYEDDTLTEGTRTGTLYDQSGHYDNAILIDGNDTFIHPDQWTTDKYKDDPDNGPWDQPYSQNCQIMKLDDFNSLTSDLEGIGFNYNYKDTIEVTINDDKKNK